MNIVYQSDSGVAILSPCIDCGLTVLEIGNKDVPVGVPFWIMDVGAFSDIPVESWEIDKSIEPDGIGGNYDQN